MLYVVYNVKYGKGTKGILLDDFVKCDFNVYFLGFFVFKFDFIYVNVILNYLTVTLVPIL